MLPAWKKGARGSVEEDRFQRQRRKEQINSSLKRCYRIGATMVQRSILILMAVALAGIVPSALSAQDVGRIVGRVLDGETGQPLSSGDGATQWFEGWTTFAQD